MGVVGRMLEADAQFVLGHCFKGYLLVSASNPAFRPQIDAALTAAEAGAAAATGRERLHVAAFTAWAEGALDRSFAAWRQILDGHPTDLLAARSFATTRVRHRQTAKIL